MGLQHSQGLRTLSLAGGVRTGAACCGRRRGLEVQGQRTGGSHGSEFGQIKGAPDMVVEFSFGHKVCLVRRA